MGALLFHRLAFLREWKNRANFDATYENLLKACCKTDATSVAKAICDVLRRRVDENRKYFGTCMHEVLLTVYMYALGVWINQPSAHVQRVIAVSCVSVCAYRKS